MEDLINEHHNFLEKLYEELNDKYGKINKNDTKKYSEYKKELDNIMAKVNIYFENKLPQIDEHIKKYQNKIINNFNESGVIENKIPNIIRINVLESIKKYADKSIIDYHPYSNNKIRDIIHPSLYPLILESIDYDKNTKKVDFWNRPYEDSHFQWLPSEFFIDKYGKCHIQSYINNLPITEIDLYNKISELFEFVLPNFEQIWSYINYVKLYDDEELMTSYKIKNYEYKYLKNRTLQVITKIVTITLDDEDSIDGAWHVEGMSHENIIATASCTIEQDDDFKASLYFKRTYTLLEARELYDSSPQNPPDVIENFANEFLIPLGKINIKQGSIIVFPNSHIHKIQMMSQNKKKVTRTIVVFWLINPNIRITSTNDINQQNYDINKAYENRLELMKERTLYKGTFNKRPLNLCEH